MSLIKEFSKIIRESKKQYQNVKGKPLILSEEFSGTKHDKESFLCCGDNKIFMKSLLQDWDMEGKIQLIYLDPPFFSRSDYDAVVKAGDTALKHLAYGDKWEQGLSAYLKMLTVRLYLMRDLLSDTGLIWLHLDWHVVHYVKVIMDEIFGEKNFVNEVIWNYKSGGSSKRHFSRKHDTLLVYSKTNRYHFYPLQEKSYNRQFKPYRFKGVREYKDDLGWYTMVNMKDVWNIDMVGRTSGERTGYATQKPEQLLARIIKSSTREGDLCADFFCGSGTLPAVAGRLGRAFIGCDAGSLAMETTIARLIGQENEFRVYRMENRKKSKIYVRIRRQEQEIPGSDQRLLRIELLSLRGRGLFETLEEKSKEKVKELLREDPLQMIESWSVDFHYDGDEGVHRPQAVFVRKGGKLETFCERIVGPDDHICIKLVDIFGNVCFERFEDERKNQGDSD